MIKTKPSKLRLAVLACSLFLMANDLCAQPGTTNPLSSNSALKIIANDDAGTCCSDEFIYLKVGRPASTADHWFDDYDMIVREAEVQIGNNRNRNRKLILYNNTYNENEFFGLGMGNNILRYQIVNSAASHVFYAGTSPTTSKELMRIAGNGNVSIGSRSLSTLDVDGGALVGRTSAEEAASVASNILNASTYYQLNGNSLSTYPALRLISGGTSNNKWNQTVDFNVGTYKKNIGAYTRLDIKLGLEGTNIPDVTVMSLLASGSVCIGKDIMPQGDAILTVNGNMYARGVVIPTTWADFVFAPQYKLKPLSEVKAFIAKNGHLPDVPSAAEIAKKGIDVAPVVKVQMQKIEELTLYILEQQKTIEDQQKKIDGQQKKLEELEKKMDKISAAIFQ